MKDRCCTPPREVQRKEVIVCLPMSLVHSFNLLTELGIGSYRSYSLSRALYSTAHTSHSGDLQVFQRPRPH
jgi:hypothetical protein